MSSDLPDVDYRRKYLAVAEIFENLSRKVVPQYHVPEEESGVWVEVSPCLANRAMFEVEILQERDTYDKALRGAGDLFLAAVEHKLLQGQRERQFYALFKTHAINGLLCVQSNLFALYAGGSRIELKDPHGDVAEYETVGEGVPPQFRRVNRQGHGYMDQCQIESPHKSRKIWPVDRRQCEHYAAICRILSGLMPPSPVTTVPSSAGDAAAGNSQNLSPPLSKAKDPPKGAFTAYRLGTILGKKQAEIAALLSKEMGRTNNPINQGQVSRWIKQVREWSEAGNILPDLPIPKLGALPVSPDVIEMGKRPDGLTKRQRPRKSDDDNEE